LAGEVQVQPIIRLKPNDTLIFIGDSITDAERHRRAYRPLGFGYVHFVGNSLVARHPQLGLNPVNTGISGDTVLDLQRRWQRDCLAHDPNVLSVLVGINDVWRRTMEPTRGADAADPDRFEVTYDQLLSRVRDQNHCQLVLMEPFLFCHDRQNPVYRALLPYIEIVRRLAAKHSAVLVPLQRRVDELIAEVPPESWSDDMVHPHLWAHAWIAQCWLEATGL
jgi:lysophospholipase L1-like esterase